MKLKIIIMIIFMILSINNVSGDSYIFEFSGNKINTFYPVISSPNYEYINNVVIGDVGYSKNIKWIMMSMTHATWSGTNLLNSDWHDVTLNIGGTPIGTGYYGFSKGDTHYYVTLFFNDDVDFSGFSGNQKINIVGGGNNIRTIHRGGSSSAINSIPSNSCAFFVIDSLNYMVGKTDSNVKHESYISYSTSNTFTYVRYDNFLSFSLIRNNNNQGRIWIQGSDSFVILSETTDYSYCIDDLRYTNISNTPIYVDFHNVYGDNKLIYVFTNDYDENASSLTTDKTYYNTNEEITISYTNIQSIYDECTGYNYNQKCEHPYELYILYPIYSDNKYNQWGAKYLMHIPYYYATDGTGIKYDDGSITLNTSILSPQNTYVLALVGKNGYYGKTEDILLMSDSFTVYPANEYLNTNCEGRSTYNGCDIVIYYKIDNNSNIIIKDNDNNIINQYYNIIDEGELIYTIPGDLEHLNTYPNWKIYLNNTNYVTSFNKDLTVYWSLFITPTETPTISPTEISDINISVQLDDLNTEVKPLKNLLFGLVYIVIDNPDYNTDNIVSENELNNWFNSIIPLSLFLCLIILYIGLHKKRE